MGKHQKLKKKNIERVNWTKGSLKFKLKREFREVNIEGEQKREKKIYPKKFECWYV